VIDRPIITLLRARGLLALSQKLETWRQRVIREKAIFSTMNLFNYDIGSAFEQRLMGETEMILTPLDRSQVSDR
jgi:hypothetical protein